MRGRALRSRSADPGAATEAIWAHLLPSSRGAPQLRRRQTSRLPSGWMSASAPSPWKLRRVGQLCLLLLASLPRLFAGRLSNCSHPLVPEHAGFRCEPSPCRGFPHRSSVRMFCEAGYRPDTSAVSWCHHGTWKPPLPTCVRLKGGAHVKVDSGIHVASTAAGVSIFLLTTTACLVVKSRLCTCLSHSSRRRSSDQLDLMGEGLPVTLPSYEEAVYGSWGQRLPACSPAGPTQLLLAREPLANQSGDAPPPYEEVQSRGRDSTSGVHRLRLSLSDDKDI